MQDTKQFNVHYGGAEANVGVSLANFGYDVYMVSKVPDNQLGKKAEKYMKSFGVNTDFLLRGGERLGSYYLETAMRTILQSMKFLCLLTKNQEKLFAKTVRRIMKWLWRWKHVTQIIQKKLNDTIRMS
ncbi:PfkB family carbohydrate kinase [Lederbergia citri]|uniref:Carbohydrate kinase PfkB domain-containing protein n=1 Tax=Lederbergia citri TaxID=2833580 RepID=A0A942YI76_9BACI|nr:PfkB family carbohydrate kinase [Lederbergia citri]MBS4195126.1 hypothetical protein [Lederbergia citri]